MDGAIGMEVGAVRLGRKNLLYSMALAGVMMLFLVGYFIYMLPSLYVEHVMEQNLESILGQHRAYMETGTYDGVRVKNATACFSVEVPLEGDSILMASKAFTAEAVLKDKRMIRLLDSFRKKLADSGILEEEGADLPDAGSGEREKDAALGEKDPGEGEGDAAFGEKDPGEGEGGTALGEKDPGEGEGDAAFGEKDPGEGEPEGRLPQEKGQEWDLGLADEMKALEGMLQEALAGTGSPLVEIRLLSSNGMEEDFFNESMKVHAYSGGLVILESSVEDAHNRFANYIAMEQTEDSIVLSVLPVVAPDADEIRPVVLQSIPMLGAVLVLLVLLFSQVYSKGIVGPILRLVRHAEDMEQAQDFTVGRLSEEWPDRKDEVRELADTLDDFYQQIKESYRELEEKNQELEEENRRQEVFLRASSHQLKTPIAAALLLVDGMINEVGRYRDTKAYLPKVKGKLLSMRKMVEEILYLNHCAEDRKLQQTDVAGLLVQRLRSYQEELADREIWAAVTGDENMVLYTDEMMIAQILDNLLSNAVKYTPRNGHIRIVLKGQNGEGRPQIRIENSGTSIDGELLPHIFGPFVRGSHDGGASVEGHGLGLYIASYYAKKLGIALSVQNGEDCVLSTLIFPG